MVPKRSSQRGWQGISVSLHERFDKVLDEPIPDGFLRLLARLDRGSEVSRHPPAR